MSSPQTSHAGDFTKNLVNNPPKTLWTRELKVSSLMLTLYHSLFLCVKVCRSIKHVHTLQARYSYLHWNGYRSCSFYVYTVAGLVSPRPRFISTHLTKKQVPHLDWLVLMPYQGGYFFLNIVILFFLQDLIKKKHLDLPSATSFTEILGPRD